jgi:hypothetical protein
MNKSISILNTKIYNYFARCFFLAALWTKVHVWDIPLAGVSQLQQCQCQMFLLRYEAL